MRPKNKLSYGFFYDSNGWNFLHYVAEFGKMKFITYVIESLKAVHGNKYVNNSHFRTEKEKLSPLDLAIVYDQKAVFQLLINDIKLSQTFSNSLELILALCSHYGRDPIEFFSGSYDCLFLYGVEVGIEEYVQVALKNGTDVNVRSSTVDPAIIIAFQNRHVEIVQILIDNNAQLNVVSLRNGSHLLHIASSTIDHPGYLELIIATGVSINVLDSEKRTPLHYTCQYGCFENFKFLLDQKGIETEAMDSELNSPMTLALRYKRQIFIDYYKQLGSKVLDEYIPQIQHRSNVTLPGMDIAGHVEDDVWKKFLDAVKANDAKDFTLNTSLARLSRQQIKEIAVLLRERLESFPEVSRCCQKNDYSLHFLIQSDEFALQKLASELSSSVVLSKEQKERSVSIFIQIIATFFALISIPYWLLLGLFSSVIRLRSFDTNDAFNLIFGIHLSGLDLYKQIITRFWFSCFVFILIASFVYIYPLLFVLLFRDSLGYTGYYLTFICILILIIIIPSLLMQRIVWKDESLKIIEFPKAQISHISLANSLYLATIFLDFFQLSAMAFIKDRFHRDSNVEIPFKLGFVSLDLFDTYWVFVVVGVITILWLIFCSFIYVCAFFRQPWNLYSIPKFNFAISMLSSTLFITIVSKLLGAIDCTTSVSGNAHLDLSPSTQCWVGNHLYLAILCSLLLLLYIYTCSIVTPFFMQSFHPSLEVHTITSYIITERSLKLVLVFTSVFLSDDRFRFVHISVSLLINVTICIMLFSIKPIDNITLCQLKTVFSVMTIWSNLCYIVTLGYGSESRDVYLPVILLLIGYGLCMIAYLIIWLVGKNRGKDLFGVNKQVVLISGRSQKSLDSLTDTKYPDARHLLKQVACIRPLLKETDNTQETELVPISDKKYS